MKKLIYFLLGACVVMLSACEDSCEVRQAEGGYTYKTSGVVRVQRGDTVSDIHLAPETGTMVLTSSKDGDKALLNFNYSGGDNYDMQVAIQNGEIAVNATKRVIDVAVAQDTLLSGIIVNRPETFSIHVNGEGKVLSNGDVCLTLTYSGHSLNDNYTLSGTDIHVHCKRNAN